MYKNDLIRKLRTISRFVTSQTKQKIITIHILLNISRSKDNLTIKFNRMQHEKYIILSMAGKLVLDPFIKN